MGDFIDGLTKYWSVLAGISTIFFFFGKLWSNMESNNRAIKKLFESYEINSRHIEGQKERDDFCKEDRTKVWAELDRQHQDKSKFRDEVVSQLLEIRTLIYEKFNELLKK